MRAEKEKVLFEDNWNPIRLPPDLPPVLLVVVDAEEEFDWSGPFTRDRHSVRSMAAQGPMHRIFEKYGIRPTYVVDYPVATQPEGIEELAAWQDEGRCIIGAHLHPWGTPPFDEPLTPANSYAGNLAPALEAAKIDVLTDAIAAGGSSLRDHRQASGELGYFQHSFRVYDRAGQPCLRDGCGGTIARIVQSGRSSFYCPACQR